MLCLLEGGVYKRVAFKRRNTVFPKFQFSVLEEKQRVIGHNTDIEDGS